jgi:RNA polymerase-binding transcription factor DksA
LDKIFCFSPYPVFLRIFFKTFNKHFFMAKTKKKPAKPAKRRVAARAKSAPRSKKVTVKAKKPVKKKPAAKKAVKKKVVARKKAIVKKATPKAAPKKAAKAKEVPVAKTSKVKEAKKVVEVVKKAEQKPAPVRPVPQLTIFPIVNQRPIAHKPARPLSVTEDKTRYSDEELKEFETLILGKLEKAREEFRILKETLNRNNDAGTDSTSGGNTKVLEDGAETAEKENLSQLAARQLKYITNLENALVRIKNGTYGICSVTGKLIPKERLIAVPHTTQSIEAKMMKQD